MGLVPIERKRILYAKFLFSLLGALILAESMVALSDLMLRSSDFVFGVQMVTAALLCVALTGMGVGLGALFPNLREQNPSKIVSGFGGTLTLILSISMVLIVIAIEALVCHHFLVQDAALDPTTDAAREFRMTMIMILGGIALVTTFAAYVPLRMGARALERMEF